MDVETVAWWGGRGREGKRVTGKERKYMRRDRDREREIFKTSARMILLFVYDLF